MRAAPGSLSAFSGKVKAAMLPMRSPHTMRLSFKEMPMTRTLTPKGDSACALSAPAGAAVCACRRSSTCQLRLLASSLCASLLLLHLSASCASDATPLLTFL